MAIIPLNSKNAQNFKNVLFDKIYAGVVGVKRHDNSCIHDNDAALRKVRPSRNIDGTDSAENLLIEISDDKITRKDLFKSEICVEVGDPYETDHPLMHVEIRG